MPPLKLYTSMVSSLMLHSHSRRVLICLSAILKLLIQLLNHQEEKENKNGLKLLLEPEDLKTYQSATELEISSESTELPYNFTKEQEFSKLMLPTRVHGLSIHATRLPHSVLLQVMLHMHSQEGEPLKRNKMLPSKTH